jgi:hypothetical protein
MCATIDFKPYVILIILNNIKTKILQIYKCKFTCSSVRYIHYVTSFCRKIRSGEKEVLRTRIGLKDRKSRERLEEIP